MRFYAKTWPEGNFNQTVILCFDSKQARAAMRPQCSQRFEIINYAEKKTLTGLGYRQVLILWDAKNPLIFKQHGSV